MVLVLILINTTTTINNTISSTTMRRYTPLQGLAQGKTLDGAAVQAILRGLAEFQT